MTRNSRGNETHRPTTRRRFIGGTAAMSVLGIAGCTGGGSDEPTRTDTPTPTNSIPYTAADPDENLGLVRDLTIENNADRDYEISTSLTDDETGETFFRRRVTVEKDTAPSYRDLIAKPGVYTVGFDFDIGLEKRYDWTIDESHGNGTFVILSGQTPTEPNVFFTIENI